MDTPETTTEPVTPAIDHAVFLNRHNLALAELASKDCSRLALQGLYVEAHRTVATDGHVMGIVDTPQVNAEDYPTAGALEVAASAKPLKAAIIGVDACKAIARAIPRKPFYTIMKNARVDVAASNVNGTLRVIASDLETTTPIEARKIELDYPAVDQVLPGGAAKLTIGFNAELLCRVLKVAGAMAKGKSHGVKLELWDDLGPMKITCTTEEGQRATFLVMPVRL